MTATKCLLYTGVLNDDYLVVEEDGSVLLTYFTYQTPWSDRMFEKVFNDLDSALEFYRKMFKERVLEQAKRWFDELEDFERGLEEITASEYWTEICKEEVEILA